MLRVPWSACRPASLTSSLSHPQAPDRSVHECWRGCYRVPHDRLLLWLQAMQVSSRLYGHADEMVPVMLCNCCESGCTLPPAALRPHAARVLPLTQHQSCVCFRFGRGTSRMLLCPCRRCGWDMPGGAPEQAGAAGSPPVAQPEVPKQKVEVVLVLQPGGGGWPQDVLYCCNRWCSEV